MTTWNNLPSFPIGSQYVAARTLLGNPCAVSGPLVAISAANTTGLVPTIQADGTIAWAAGGGGGSGDITEVTAINGLNGGATSGAAVVGLAVHAINAIATLNNITGPAFVGKATGAGQAAAITTTASTNAVVRESGGSAGWGTIVAEGLADGALRADTVGRAKMADSFVNTAKLLDDAVNFAKAGFYLGQFTASAANDFDIALPSGYQGQDINFIDIDIEATSASSAFGDILLNGSDTVDTMNTGVNDGSVTVTDAADGPIVVSTTERTYLHIRLHLRDGGVRIGFARCQGLFGANWRRYESWFRWADTTTDITSIRLRLDGGVNWTAGSIASVWVG